MPLPTEEQQRITKLYRDFGQVIYRRCLKLLQDGDRARDATQEVFLKLTREFNRLQDDDTLLRWIYRVATHHCLDVMRDSARRENKEAGFAVWEIRESNDPEHFPDRQLASQVLSRFDAQTQAVALGILVDGMQQDELAAALGVSTRTVARRLDRFLSNARKYIHRSAS